MNLKTISFVAASLTIAPTFVIADDHIDFGGTLRAKYQYKDYAEASKDKNGDFQYDMFAIKANGEIKDIEFFAEYRFYDGYDMARLMYAAYEVNDDILIKGGLTAVPFGNPGFISNNFWMSVGTYFGFEDDYDMGFTVDYKYGPHKTEFGYFKNSEYNPSKSARYGYDLKSGVVNGTEYYNEETNQFNLRQTYTYTNGSFTTIFGASAMMGDIYNEKTGNNGDRWAAAASIDSRYNGWKLQLQAIAFEFDAADAEDHTKIAMSAFNWHYEVASKGMIYQANIAKKIPTSFGAINLYNDFGFVAPDTDDKNQDDSLQNVIGMSVATGPLFTHFDFISGKNMYGAGTQNHIGLKDNVDEWEHRFNVSISYYF